MDNSKYMSHITIASYAHPELYPPVLSAIEQLSKITETIDLVTRNTLKSQWEYPKNVTINYVNKQQYEGFGIEKIPTWMKLQHFVNYVFLLKRLIKKNNSKILIVHDVIPLFAAFLLRGFLKRKKVKLWYHNHDVTDMTKAGHYSLMGIAAVYEKRAFHYIDIFTLPSKERLEYFPIEVLKNQPIILPNYPLKSFYSKAHKETSDTVQTIKLVFQGSIGDGHGLEEIISILNEPINGKQLELHLVGKLRDSYLKKLENLVDQHNVQAYFKYHGMQPFAKLPQFLSQFDIGIAIHKPYNVTYSTGGTASNKIYEYAALAMPVLLFDNAHYRTYLGERDWTFFTDLTKQSLRKEVEMMDTDLSLYSKNAYDDFQNEFNFEQLFQDRLIPVLQQYQN